MANSTTNINIRMDSDLKAQADAPNKETISAMLEAERIAKDPSIKGYTDLDELFADLKS
jgi:DNA-damage-inducible protein J